MYVYINAYIQIYIYRTILLIKCIGDVRFSSHIIMQTLPTAASMRSVVREVVLMSYLFARYRFFMLGLTVSSSSCLFPWQPRTVLLA